MHIFQLFDSIIMGQRTDRQSLIQSCVSATKMKNEDDFDSYKGIDWLSTEKKQFEREKLSGFSDDSKKNLKKA